MCRALPALLAGGLCAGGDAQSIADGSYAGELRGDEVSFLGLEIRGQELRIDLTSQWTLGISVAATRAADGGSLSFDLPADLGRASLHAEGPGLAGTVQRADGCVGTLALRATPAPSVRLEQLDLVSGDVHLAATLGLPAGPGPHPALILVPGGGSSERGQPSTRFLAEYLPRLGFACLVYDKRGCGDSSGDWREVGLAALADDALAALAALEVRDDVDSRALGFFAASQGTWVALEACARASGRVAFVVNHSGPAVPLLEADTYALRSTGRAAGLSAEELGELLGLWEHECQALRIGVPPAEHAPLLAAIESARGRAWFARLPYEATPTGSWWLRWYPRVMDCDPCAALERLEPPMLWLYGACDAQSDVVRNVELLSALARERGKPWSIHVFPGGDHGISVPLWRNAGTRGPATMASGYFETLRGWLEREVERIRAAASEPREDSGSGR